MLYDLNVPWPGTSYTGQISATQRVNLNNTITTLYLLGYHQIAINFQVADSVKMPVNSPQHMNPISIKEIRNELNQTKFPGLKLYTRLTLIVSDPSKCQGLSKLQNHYDLLAIQPVTEKALQLCTTNLDIDLVSFAFHTKLPFFLKYKTIGSAVEKGIRFEINYSSIINTQDAAAKRNFFHNVIQLVRSSRSKGIIVSSGAVSPIEARNSSDILNLLQTLGLDSSRAKACVTLNPERALVSGRLRIKSYKQTIVEGNSGQDVLTSHENGGVHKRKLEESSGGKLLKKYKSVK